MVIVIVLSNTNNKKNITKSIIHTKLNKYQNLNGEQEEQPQQQQQQQQQLFYLSN